MQFSLRRNSSESAGDFWIVGVGFTRKYKCKVCHSLSKDLLEHGQHKEGQKHQDALKTYCPDCRIHCHLCDVHSSGPLPWRQHLLGNQHKTKLAAAAALNKASHAVSNPSAVVLQCPACQQDFAEVADLKDHVKASHDLLLTCTECETRGHNPKGQALFCQELVEHYSQVHNKKMEVTDLPYYGKKGGEKMTAQGYVVCKLCPKPSYQTLGSPGLWMTNQPNLTTIKSHFKKFHPENVWNYKEKIVLGCQLCEDKLPGTRDLSLWRALLDKHKR